MVEKVHHNVLVATGEVETARMVLEILAGRGIRGMVVGEMGAALEKVQSRRWDLVLADLEMPDGDGYEFLRRVKKDSPELPVVMFSERGSVHAVVRAVRAGCEDFLVKPLDRKVLETLLEALLPNHEVPLAAAAERESRCLYQIVGKSPVFLETIRVAKKTAPTSVPVLVTGESGTGKELISYLVHRQSNRCNGPYIRVNCASLSESLLGSELFGHERGAFTGAIARRKGRFERAHGGTLLLDEISETGPHLQAELLRVLEQQDFERLGGSELIRVNVRVISTSNRDLAADVEQGRFRRDLYYRISGVHLTVPPLRKRVEDIPALVWHFVNLYAREVRRHIAKLDQEMLEAFRRYHWPGNVRQLRSVVRTALILGEGSTLSLEAVPALPKEIELLSGRPCEPAMEDLTLSLRDLERQAILEAMRRTDSHQAKAARLLGITDRTLREKLRKYQQQGHLQTAGAR